MNHIDKTPPGADSPCCNAARVLATTAKEVGDELREQLRLVTAQRDEHFATLLATRADLKAALERNSSMAAEIIAIAHEFFPEGLTGLPPIEAIRLMAAEIHDYQADAGRAQQIIQSQEARIADLEAQLAALAEPKAPRGEKDLECNGIGVATP